MSSVTKQRGILRTVYVPPNVDDHILAKARRRRVEYSVVFNQLLHKGMQLSKEKAAC